MTAQVSYGSESDSITIPLIAMSSRISIIAKSLLSEAGLDSGGYATRVLEAN